MVDVSLTRLGLYGQVHFSVERVSGYFSILPYFIEIHVFNANSEDPDQKPRS